MTPYAKPRLAGRGFAQSTWLLVAFFHYYIDSAGANICLPFMPVAIDGMAKFLGDLS